MVRGVLKPLVVAVHLVAAQRRVANARIAKRAVQMARLRNAKAVSGVRRRLARATRLVAVQRRAVVARTARANVSFRARRA